MEEEVAKEDRDDVHVMEMEECGGAVEETSEDHQSSSCKNNCCWEKLKDIADAKSRSYQRNDHI